MPAPVLSSLGARSVMLVVGFARASDVASLEIRMRRTALCRASLVALLFLASSAIAKPSSPPGSGTWLSERSRRTNAEVLSICLAHPLTSTKTRVRPKRVFVPEGKKARVTLVFDAPLAELPSPDVNSLVTALGLCASLAGAKAPGKDGKADMLRALFRILEGEGDDAVEHVIDHEGLRLVPVKS